MNFICQIFKFQDPSAPSLKQLNGFKLPGFVPPKKVRCYCWSFTAFLSFFSCSITIVMGSHST